MFLKKNISSIFGILLIISITLIAGCSTSQSAAISLTPTFSRFLPATWTPTITLTPTVTKTLTPTIPPSLASTVTQTLPPSLTPLPTISIDSLKLEFEILLATNGGCRLPCFWGNTPRITTVAELEQFAHQFPADLVETSDDHYTIYYVTSKTGDTTFSVNFSINNDLIQSIHLRVDTARYYVTLSKILSSYGTPTRILIGPPEYDGLSMFVLYEDQQFMGQYNLFQNQFDNSLYCYDPRFSPSDVITWSSDQSWQGFINEQQEPSYKLLDEVSDYDIQSFQKILATPNRALCMNIQTDKILP